MTSESNISVINKELKIYIRYCMSHPETWIPLAGYVAKRFSIRISDRIHTHNKFHHYPKDTRQWAEKCKMPDSLPANWQDSLLATGWLPGSGPSITEWNIPLASKRIHKDAIDWKSREDDPEDDFALHRFGWMLRWLSLRPPKKCLEEADAIILLWINQVDAHTYPAAWETYSVSERIVNWLLYFCATNTIRELNHNQAEQIGLSILEQIDHMVCNLEYYGKRCNNHILNNARSLYMAGRILYLEKAAHLGCFLFRKHLHEIVDSTGVLLEGSSHYQLLLTRTMQEVMWVALETEDRKFSREIKDIVEAMVRFSKKLSVSYKEGTESIFHLIGDLSPDFPIDWFMDEPECGKNGHGERWVNIWSYDKIKPVVDSQFTENDEPWFHPEWHFVSFENSDLEVVVYARKLEEEYPAAHGHFDFGSYVLYDRKGPVLSDRGRFGYTADGLARYGFSSTAHNTSLINGLPVVPESRGIFFGYQRLNEKNADFYIKKGSSTALHWSSGTVGRIYPELKWKKELIAGENMVESIETLINPWKRNLVVQFYLHWAPGWIVNQKGSSDPDVVAFAGECMERIYFLKLEASVPGIRFNLYKGKEEDFHGWHFSGYGMKEPATTIMIEVNARETFTCRWVLYRK